MPRITVIRLALLIWWVALATLSHWPRLDLADVGIDNTDVVFGFDKWGHVIAFGVLTLLLIAARPRRRGMMLGALLIAAIYVPIDEFTQALVPGRNFGFDDMLASWLGVGLAGAGWFVIRLVTHPGESFVHHARTMSILTLGSRILGLVRDWSLAFALGFGGVYDAFVIAFMIPNLFRRLFGEGSLAAAFIPPYTRLRESDPPAADRFAAWVIRLLAGRLLLIAGVICAGAVGLMLTLGAGEGPAWAPLLAITIWYMPLVCVLAILGAVLQVHQRFAIPSAAPVVLNLAIISAALVGAIAAGLQPFGIVLLVCGAVVVAGVLQVGWAWWGARRSGANLALRYGSEGSSSLPGVEAARRAMLKQWLPMTLALAAFQINNLLDVVIAKVLSGEPGETFSLFGRVIDYPMQHGAVAVLGSTARLYEFPLGVFGIAVASAIYPALSRRADDAWGFASLVRQGLRLTIFIGLPASVGLVLVRQPLAEAIYYDRGRIEARDAARVAWVLLGYAPAVWAYSMNHLLNRIFYARNDARTPMRLTLVMVTLNLLLNLTLVWLPIPGNPTGERLGIAGLAWSTAICAMIQCLVLLVLARRHVIGLLNRRVVIGWLRCGVATLLMAAAVIVTVHDAPGWVGIDTQDLTHMQTAVWLAAATLIGAGVYLALARLLGMDELRWIVTRRQNP